MSARNSLFRCPRCGRTSSNPNDAREGYCGACHAWTAPAGAGADPRMVAAVDLLGRTGAIDIQVRYSDDEQPVVWFAVVRHRLGSNGRPAAKGPVNHWDTAAGRNPVEALMRLCERMIDGGECTHCNRPTMFLADIDDSPTPLDPLFCSYQWDPELSTFRRSCEGSAA